MIATLTLHTDGFQVVWNFISYNQADRVFNINTEMSLIDPDAKKLIEDVSYFLFVRDVERLITYFEDYIASQTDSLLSASHIYVPLELGFQLQALSGDIEFDEATNRMEGYYWLRFMTKLINGSGRSVYVGAESTISIFETRKFVEGLRMILSST